MTGDYWIIDCRTPTGVLDPTGPQPEDVFGDGAMRGLSEHHLAHVVYKRLPLVSLLADSISSWPALIDPRWRARRRAW